MDTIRATSSTDLNRDEDPEAFARLLRHHKRNNDTFNTQRLRSIVHDQTPWAIYVGYHAGDLILWVMGQVGVYDGSLKRFTMSAQAARVTFQSPRDNPKPRIGTAMVEATLRAAYFSFSAGEASFPTRLLRDSMVHGNTTRSRQQALDIIRRACLAGMLADHNYYIPDWRVRLGGASFSLPSPGREW